MKKRNQSRPEAFLDEPMNLSDRLGSEVRAWVFGAVVKGARKASRCLDVYISGGRAETLEAEYFGKRPLIAYEGEVYPMRLIGPTTVSEEIFIEKHSEAVRII